MKRIYWKVGGAEVLAVSGFVLAGLKLAGYLTWPWWVVTMPFWLFPAGIALVPIVTGLFVLGGFLFLLVLEHLRLRRHDRAQRSKGLKWQQ